MILRLLPLALALAALPARAVVPPINEGTLTLVNEVGYNKLDITLSVTLFGSQTKQSTVTGSLLARLAIDPATDRSPEFTILGGSFQGTPVSFSLRNFLLGSITATSSTIGGTMFTITPPGLIDPATGIGDASQHQFVINQGTVTGSAVGNPLSVNFATDPASGKGSGSATVTITRASTTATRAVCNVTVTLPVNLTEPIPNDYGLTATFSATGTFKAAGQVSVPLSDYLAWTEVQNVPGADPNADPNQDGIPNGLLWALGLSLNANPRPHLIVADPASPRGFRFTLPAGGAGGPLFIESSTSLAPDSWSLASPAELSLPANPLPAGTTGTITIAPSSLPSRFLRLRAEP
jgi:hypothetical protein